MILYCTYDVRSMYLSYTSKTSNGHALVFISIEPLHTNPNIHVIIVYVYHIRTTVKPVNTPGHVYNSIQRYNTCTIVHIRTLFGQSPNIVGSYVCNLGNRPYVHYATYKIYECCNILFPYVRSPILYDSARYFVVRVVYLFFCRSLVVCLLLLFARLPPRQLIIFS